jgi:hypothetical protein
MPQMLKFRHEDGTVWEIPASAPISDLLKRGRCSGSTYIIKCSRAHTRNVFVHTHEYKTRPTPNARQTQNRQV